MALNGGKFINHWSGPYWTPYARAIAEQYAVQSPIFMTVPTTLTGAALERRTVITDPYQYDVLLFGAHIDMGTDTNGDNGQQIFLQVSGLDTGLSWVTPGPFNGAPATAFGGSRTQPMPILKLPEAFFLAANTRLKHDWSMFSLTATGGSLTWLGVQLSNPCGLGAPETVTMPDGSVIRVGGRLPWLAVIGLGREQVTGGALNYQLNAGRRFLHYTPPVDCDIEIHDIHCNFFSQLGVANDPNLIQFTLSDEGEREMWSRTFAPSPALMGAVTQAYPGLPLTKPYLLKKNRQLLLTVLNNGSTGINNGFVVIRGVKLCAL